MSVISKWKLTHITMMEGQRRKRDEGGRWITTEQRGFVVEPCTAGEIRMAPVYAHDDDQHENTKFWDASPQGEFKMTVNNLEALAHLEPGKEYYLTITEAK